MEDTHPDPDAALIDFTPVDVQSIRSRSLPWSAYKTLVSDHIIQLMIQYDKQSPETQAKLLLKQGEEYADAFVHLLAHLHHLEPLQYILTLLSDVLAADENGSRSKLFHGLVGKGVEPYLPFIRLLNLSNWYILKNALDIVCLLLSTSDTAPRSHHDAVVMWVCRLLASPKLPEHAVGAVLDSLVRLLRVQENRVAFARNDGLARLATLANTYKTNATFLYKIGLNLWLLSYNDAVSLQFGSDGVLSTLVDVVRSVEAEKVLRVFLSCLKNLVMMGKLNEDLIDLGLLKAINLFTTRAWNDEDIVEDLKVMSEALHRDYKELTTFEKYSKEVMAGRLDWTPAHTNETFWRENINRFEKGDFELIRVLVGTLQSTESSVKAITVALNDIGEFARNHARGKNILQEMGGKERVMELLNHEDASVRKHALLCMQKMLVQKHQLAVK